MNKEFYKAGQLLLVIIFSFKVYSQENPERLRQLQVANQGNPPGTPSGIQAAKIEASKGTKTLPPGINTTQMVSEQYKSSGTLKPYQTTIQSNGTTGVFVPSSSARNNSKIPPGTPSKNANTNVPPGNPHNQTNHSQTSSGTLANQLPTNFPNSTGSKEGITSTATNGANSSQRINQYSPPPVGGAIGNSNVSPQKSSPPGYEQPGSPLGNSTTPLPNSGAFRAPYSTGPANNTYDKVPGLNPYQPSASSPANPYGSLQLTPGYQQTGGSSGVPPSRTGTSTLSQVSNNTYGAPPVTGKANGEKRTHAYGPAPQLNAQGSSNTYGAPPITGANNTAQPTGTYGPAPQLNAQGSNNTYGAPPVTGANNAGKPTGTYGPAPQLNAQGSNNTYGAPPVTGANNAGKPTGTYGPAPQLNAQGTNNMYSAPPVTGGQSAVSVPATTQPNSNNVVNPKTPANSPKGAANNVSPKKGPPKRG